jgi:hypothetical protein
MPETVFLPYLRFSYPLLKLNLKFSLHRQVFGTDTSGKKRDLLVAKDGTNIAARRGKPRQRVRLEKSKVLKTD